MRDRRTPNYWNKQKRKSSDFLNVQCLSCLRLQQSAVITALDSSNKLTRSLNQNWRRLERIHPLCSIDSQLDLRVFRSAVTISVSTDQLSPSLCLPISCHHLCVFRSAVTISVSTDQLSPSPCLPISCHHLRVYRSAVTISVSIDQLSSSPCLPFSLEVSTPL